jgi:Rad3-related DNA helicase
MTATQQEAQLAACFPHAPYDIQAQFMRHAYEALEQRQIGLFESPTGVCCCRGHSTACAACTARA